MERRLAGLTRENNNGNSVHILLLVSPGVLKTKPDSFFLSLSLVSLLLFFSRLDVWNWIWNELGGGAAGSRLNLTRSSRVCFWLCFFFFSFSLLSLIFRVHFLSAASCHYSISCKSINVSLSLSVVCPSRKAGWIVPLPERNHRKKGVRTIRFTWKYIYTYMQYPQGCREMQSETVFLDIPSPLCPPSLRALLRALTTFLSEWISVCCV